MGAPKGNSYYLLAVGFKKPKSYTPQALWKKAVEYVKWVAENPLPAEKVFSNGKRLKEKKLRAMTIQEFCLFAKITRETFNQYEKEKDYSDICLRIKDIFFNQKFQGAAADMFNHAIIARELGLADKTDITTNGKAITPPVLQITTAPIGVPISEKEE